MNCKAVEKLSKILQVVLQPSFSVFWSTKNSLGATTSRSFAARFRDPSECLVLQDLYLTDLRLWNCTSHFCIHFLHFALTFGVDAVIPSFNHYSNFRNVLFDSLLFRENMPTQPLFSVLWISSLFANCISPVLLCSCLNITPNSSLHPLTCCSTKIILCTQ